MGGTVQYRNLARVHLKSAENELGTHSDQRLKYAALELRMAMEALTYDRALSYKDEFPPQEYETWQPRKIISVLLTIDPMADKDRSLAVGTETQYGIPPREMHSLGSEKVLNMNILRDHYDALGSYLHVQSMKKFLAGQPPNFVKIRARCEEIAAFINLVLSSPIFNVTLGNFSRVECVECGTMLRKRIPYDKKEVLAECYQCKATYTITDEGSGQCVWIPNQIDISCANTSCQKTIVVWKHELEVGNQWKCESCNGQNIFVLALKHEADNVAPQPQSPLKSDEKNI